MAIRGQLRDNDTGAAKNLGADANGRFTYEGLTVMRDRFTYSIFCNGYTNNRWLGPQQGLPRTELWDRDLGTAATPTFPAQYRSLIDLRAGSRITRLAWSISPEKASGPTALEWRMVAVQKTTATTYAGTDTKILVSTQTSTAIPTTLTSAKYYEHTINYTTTAAYNHILFALHPTGSGGNNRGLVISMTLDVERPVT